MKQINISASFLMRITEKGYDYAVAEKLGMITKETSPMSAGKAMHSYLSAVFGGKVEKIAISPFDSFRTNDAKAWRDSQPDDTIIIKAEDAEIYKEIATRVRTHIVMKRLIKGGKLSPELKIEKAVGKHNVKGFLDLFIESEAKTVVDYKFVSPSVFDDFGRKALWQNYDLQAAVYDFLGDATHVYFCIIENEAPYRIKFMFCTPSFMESGAEKFNKAMKIIDAEKWREPTFNIESVDDLVAWGF